MKKIYTILFILLFLTEVIFTNLIKADWVQVNNGLNNLSVNALCSYSSGGINYIFAGTRQFAYQDAEIYLSTNNGNSWTSIYTPVNGGDIFDFAVTNAGGINYVYSGTLGYIFRSTNNGLNWLQMPFPNGNHWYYSIAASGNYVFAGLKWWSWDSGGVYKSTNFGDNWVKTTYPVQPYQDVYSLAINGNNVYASGIYVSTNLGSNWTTPGSGPYGTAFAINGNYIFAGTGGGPYGVWISSNNGFNWTQTSLNYGDIGILSVYNNIIFAGGAISGGGFYVSTNNGLSWVNKSDGLINLVGGIVISNNYIFVATGGAGVYKRPLSEIVGINKITGTMPKNYKLSQNFPNPFNSSTLISYELPFNNHVTLKIYDILGKENETLVDEKQSSGKYSINWDASKNSSGIYFCRFVAVSANKNEVYMSVIKLILNK
jgi:hypothetical protein